MMQHFSAEGTTLVKQAEDAASNKKVCAISSFVSVNVYNIPTEKIHFH